MDRQKAVLTSMCVCVRDDKTCCGGRRCCTTWKSVLLPPRRTANRDSGANGEGGEGAWRGRNKLQHVFTSVVFFRLKMFVLSVLSIVLANLADTERPCVLFAVATEQISWEKNLLEMLCFCQNHFHDCRVGRFWNKILYQVVEEFHIVIVWRYFEVKFARVGFSSRSRVK